MSTNLFGANKLTRFQPAEKSFVGRRKVAPKPDKLKKAAQNFEAIFIAQLLQNVRKSMPKSGLFGDGFSGSMYQSMFDNALAKEVAGKGGFHLSDIIVKSFQTSGTDQSTKTGLTLVDYRLNPIRQITNNFIGKYWDHSIIEQAAKKFELDPKLIEAVIKVESDFNPHLVSGKGAVGLMQLMPETAKELGVRNRHDPVENVFAGSKYLKKMLDRFDNNVEMALGAYNAGPGAVEKYGDVPPYKETQNYVKKVLTYYESL